MTNRMQNPITCTSGDHKMWPLCALEVEAELENLDRRAGRDYLPMDVFVDPRTRAEHFQFVSIRARRSGIH